MRSSIVFSEGLCGKTSEFACRNCHLSAMSLLVICFICYPLFELDIVINFSSLQGLNKVMFTRALNTEDIVSFCKGPFLLLFVD